MSILKKKRRACFKLFILFVLFLFLIIGSVCALFNSINYFNPKIAQKISESIGNPVKIGHIKSYWFGLNPRIELTDLVISDKNHSAQQLQIKKIRLKIDLFASLAQRKLVLNDLIIDGSQLVVQQRPDRNIAINNLVFTMQPTTTQATHYIDYTKLNYYLTHIDLTYLDANHVMALHDLNVVFNHHQQHISSQKLTIISPAYLLKPLVFDSVSADWRLDHYANYQSLSLINIQLKNRLAALQGKLDLHVGAKNSTDNSINLTVNYLLNNISVLQAYINRKNLPIFAMQDWISGNTLSGEIYYNKIFNNNTTSIKGNVYLNDVNLKTKFLKLQHTSGTILFDYPNVKNTKINLGIDQFVLANYPFNKIIIEAKPVNNTWLVNIRSPAIISKITIPTDLSKQPIRADFERFVLLSKTVNSIKKSANSTGAIRPNQIPSFMIRFKNFYYDKDNLGRIQLITKRLGNTLLVQNFSVNTRDINLFISGYWSGQGYQRSAFKGHIATTNFGDFLNDWDISDSLEGAKGTLDFNLQWPGPIYNINLAKLNGQLVFSLSDGTILNIADNNYESVGRILNIVSVDSLEFLFSKPFGSIAPKRKGFDFDVEQANFVVRNGILQTDNFYLKGKLAEVKSQGQIGLAKRNYNLYVTITPYLTAYLPMNLAWAGGPAMYGIVWTANKFMGGIFNVFFRQIYHVTGSWNKPIYQKVSSIGDINYLNYSVYKN